MAVGGANCATPPHDGKSGKPLEEPQSAPFVNIPRPLNSPRSQPQKRRDCSFLPPCQIEDSGDVECSPAKKARGDSEVSRHAAAQDTLTESPETRGASPVALTPEKPCLPSKKPLDDAGPTPALYAVVKNAMQLYKDALTCYALEYDLMGEQKANYLAERISTQHYPSYKSAILGLLPWLGEMETSVDESYHIVQFQRRAAAFKEVEDLFEGRKEQLEHLQAENPEARAWQALITVLAAISSRKEKVWLEYDDIQGEYVEKMLKNQPLCRAKGSAKRVEAIREYIPKLIQEGELGAFVEALLDTRAVHRVTFARGLPKPLPATSMTFRRMPLWDALRTMDDDGPLRGAAKKKEWCAAAGRQFAFQDLQLEHEFGSRTERIEAKDVKPDPKLRDLLRSKKPVVLLDTLAALAPRDVSKKHGISAVVKAELCWLLQEAKSKGEAVVFHLGSGDSHKLAQKVYMCPPVSDFGLRCGCLRWRESADVPWAREMAWDWRIRMCLQMP